MPDDDDDDVPTLQILVDGTGPLTDETLKQIQRWVDADWESHDVDHDVLKLIRRLLDTVKAKS